jgi:hypothetical protein
VLLETEFGLQFCKKMAVNLVKYKDELLKGWQEVVDDKNPTDWVLFTYDGQSYDLKVFSKGGVYMKILMLYKNEIYELFL